MGCTFSPQSQVSVEDRLRKHMNVLKQVCKAKEPDESSELKLRKELHHILDIAKPHDKIDSKIFYDMIFILDDLNLEFPTVSDKLKTLINAVKHILRIRCLGEKKSPTVDSDEPILNQSFHVHQRNIPEAAIIAIDSNMPLRKNDISGNAEGDEGGDYGFFDTSMHSQEFISPAKLCPIKMLKPLEENPD